MATLNPLNKSNAAALGKQSPPPPTVRGTGGAGYSFTQDQSWVQPPRPATARGTGGAGYSFTQDQSWVQPPVVTDTGTPPVVTPTHGTGGNAPSQLLPPSPFLTSTQGNINQGVYAPVLDEAMLQQNYLDQFLGADSALMRNARTSGIEAAAARGLQNSTLAAGASQRAALEYAVPLAQQAMETFNQRENRGWQTQQDREQRAWTASQNQLDRDQQITMSQVQNWLNNESFQREFNAQLALFPIQNSTQLMNAIAEQAITNPEIYTPDIISGMSEFFTTNFLDVLSRYFPSLYEQQGGNV